MTPSTTLRALSKGAVQAFSKRSFLTTKEVARLTGLSTSYFEKGRCLEGKGPPYYKLQGRVLYWLPDLVAWLDARRISPERHAKG